MKKSQLNAIGYAYQKRKQAENAQELQRRGLSDVWEFQTVYKTLTGFLHANAKGLEKAKKSAIINLKNYLKRCEQCRQTAHADYINRTIILNKLIIK